MRSLAAQFRQILRRLARAPMFTVVTLLTLGIGIGANTAIFSVIEGVLLKPLPYPQPDRLVSALHSAPGLHIPRLESSPSNYLIYREQSKTFENIGLYERDSVTVTGLAEPEQVPAMDITETMLPILGARPMLGRGFNQEDVAPGGADTAILSYGYWNRRFGGDRSAVGKTITLDGKLHQVIGVLPQNFRFLDRANVAIFLPIKLDRSKIYLGNFSYQSIARLKPGVTLEQASADVARMLPIVERTFSPPPGMPIKIFQDAKLAPSLKLLKDDVVGDVGKVLWVLMGGIGLVLLIACANAANLLLVRAEGRQHEFAIRAALGASRGRLAGEMLLEGLLVAFVSGIIGLALAFGALKVLVAIAPTGLPRLNDIGIDGTVVLFTLGVSLAASLLSCLIPVVKYAGAGLGTGLREGGRSVSESRERHRARAVLVVGQVAIALVLLVSSGLMIRSFMALTHVDPGFTAPSQLQTFRVYIPESQVKSSEAVARMEEAMLHKLEAIPGVTRVGLADCVPLDSSNRHDPVFAKDQSYTDQKLPIYRFRFLAPGALKAMGTPLVAGRDFAWEDLYEKHAVAMVSESMARKLWKDPSAAVGKQVRVGNNDDWREVVGVVGDVHYDGMEKEPPGTAYWPMLLENFSGDKGVQVRRSAAFAVRSPLVGSQSLMNEIRQAVWSVDSSLPLFDVHTMDYYLARSMARTSFTLVMLAVAGGMALLLGIIGLYGVIAYSVSQRRREIGIRMALGAQRQALVGMFVRYALGLAGVGVVCGLAAAYALTRLMSSFLFNVKPTDAVTYFAVSLGLILTAALSSYIPARRAAAVNPTESLRAE